MPKVQKQNLKNILILHTGGTIAMEAHPSKNSKGIRPLNGFVKLLKQNVPELWELANIEIQLLTNKDSSQIGPPDWIHLAETIVKKMDDYDGFVITHGTDTMVYTGTALSYLLPYPCKPVVLTGSQRPLQEIRNDARRNLIHSVSQAAAQWIYETCIFFDTLLLRANRTKKIHIEEFHTFDSPNFSHLAEEKLKTVTRKPPRESVNRPFIYPIFDSSAIQVVKVFPGCSFKLDTKSKVVVLEAYGCGTLPTSAFSFLELCRAKKIPVVLTSQVQSGSLTPEIYDVGKKALELGAISARDMTFEATLVKCMMLAGNKIAYKNWTAGIQSNWAGEITPLLKN